MNKKLVGGLALSLIALTLVACVNLGSDVEESDQPLSQDQEKGEESTTNEGQFSEDLDYYENTVFGYKINLPEEYDISTEGVAMMPVVHNESIWIRVEFNDGGEANLNSMDNIDTFPELKDGRINLSAEEYVKAWWEDNFNDDNPNIQPVLGQLFQKTFNGITWYGFTVENSVVYANSTGGGLLKKPLTVLLTKNNGVFYRWEFDADLVEKVDTVLENFKFTN